MRERPSSFKPISESVVERQVAVRSGALPRSRHLSSDSRRQLAKFADARHVICRSVRATYDEYVRDCDAAGVRPLSESEFVEFVSACTGMRNTATRISKSKLPLAWEEYRSLGYAAGQTNKRATVWMTDEMRALMCTKPADDALLAAVALFDSMHPVCGRRVSDVDVEVAEFMRDVAKLDRDKRDIDAAIEIALKLDRRYDSSHDYCWLPRLEA